MLEFFKYFITAPEAKSRADTAYNKRQKEIRDDIEKDITRYADRFEYKLKYSIDPFCYSCHSNISERTKVKFVIEHKEEFESMGYNISYRAYSYVPDDGSGDQIVTHVDQKVKKVSRSYKEAEYIYLTISWANEEK